MALEDLVDKHRAALKERAQHRDIAHYVQRDRPSERSFRDALSADPGGRADQRVRYVLECDPTSPWQKVARIDEEPAELARMLASVADALSVSADPSPYDGDLERLAAVSDAVAIPILCDEMIVDPYQIYEARHFGADAILLMPSVLDDVFDRCVEAAEKLAIDVVAVIRNEDDLECVLARDLDIIGIDNRDFQRGTYDPQITGRLAPKIPEDRLVLSIGGVDQHHQAVTLRPHVDAFVTGGSLLTGQNIPRALRQLVYGRVKVCGLTSGEQAEAAWQAGAIYGGLIFASGSARYVTYDKARSITASAPLDFVGVFVDETINQIACCAERLDLAAVQLHGHESNEYMLELRRHLPKNTEIWKACHVEGELPKIASMHCDRVLLDNFERDANRSTSVFDWSVLEGLDEKLRRRIVLSGGLTPANAARADQFGTWALDVNLGVETSAGIKSRPLLDRFFAELRGKRRS